ncbi:hypothetical protein GVN21_20255 [Caulobacter sp. SLTY]|uniref:hypothetical protein n=1 Tax=Caulobacter sp. SLTY TaxID=2683262 RepID=UPI0014131405|nr:hypothetical protein [Caulobacter sp. SLTY]NBB17700.1 hypothetical protein [Caulobacter sp. SLTY]
MAVEAWPRGFRFRQAARRAAMALSKLPNVSHVTLGEKETGGRGTGRLALKVHVARKGDIDAAGRAPAVVSLRSRQRIALGLLETDVIETSGAPAVSGIASGGRLIGFGGDRGVAGLAFTKGRFRYLATNAHVVFNLANGQTGPVQWDTGSRPAPLGPVVRWIPIRPGQAADGDLAIVRVDGPTPVRPYWLEVIEQPIDRIDDMGPSELDHWFVAKGAQHLCGAPEPVLSGAWVDVDGVRIFYRGFWQLRMRPGFRAEAGQSGALLCRTAQGLNVGCGLVFGRGSDELVWAYPFATAFEEMFAALAA